MGRVVDPMLEEGRLGQLVDAAEARWLDDWRRGPRRLRWSTLPVQAGDAAPDLELLEPAGERVALSSFWREQPALIVFWRHFGCGCGMERAGRLVQEQAEYVSAGARVAIIGQGEPERAAAYAARYGMPPDAPVLSDPSRTAYERYGLLEGTPAQILFDAPDEFLRCEEQAGVDLARSRREAGRPMVDSPWLLPGEFVVDTSGTIRLAYRYQYCEDFPDPRVLIATIRAAAGTL